MKDFLKNMAEKAKETFEQASEDIQKVVDAVAEDTANLAQQAKEKLSEAKEDFTDSFGEPSEIVDKAKKVFTENSEKVKDATSETFAGAAGWFQETKTKAREEFTEHVGDPDDLLAKAKAKLTETGEKLTAAAKEEWQHANQKLEELKKSVKKDGGEEV